MTASSSSGGTAVTATGRDQNKLREDILQREPVEPARSPKQLYVTEWLSKHKKKKVRFRDHLFTSFLLMHPQ